MLPDVNIVLGTMLGLVFLAAAGGKLTSPTSTRVTASLGLTIGELALGVALLSRWEQNLVAPLAMLVSAILAVVALTRPTDHRCACFGSKLPSTQRAGQIWRNGVLVVVAIGFASLTGLQMFGPPKTIWLDLSLSIVLASAVVGGPWLQDWVAGGDVRFGNQS